MRCERADQQGSLVTILEAEWKRPTMRKKANDDFRIFETTFNPEKSSYRNLLEFFFQMQDATTCNRQGNDTGASYRSTILYLDDTKRRVVEDTIADVEASGLWPDKVVTEITLAGPLWEAEPEHQDYLE